MALKYPNKIKRAGYWKSYERSKIKDYRKVWDTAMEFIAEEDIPFQFSKFGRKPNLTRKEYVCMAIMYAYFNRDFRETEFMIRVLTGKNLDHSNCVRWFGRLTPFYINDLVYKVHKKIISISDIGDYVADSTKLSCDRYEPVLIVADETVKKQMLKIHILIQYLVQIGILSIVSVFVSSGEVNDGPSLRNELLKKERIIPGKKCHADKGYFGKENLRKCEELGLQPNMVPQDVKYTDAYLKRYVRKGYDNESRKQNRGMVEGVFGGMEKDTEMKVRCRKPEHREIFVSLLALKYNLRACLRATALKVLFYFAPTPNFWLII